ncbi:MAG TPA: DUF362 domain-containing protein [Deltaproteobacteria bacterium]|nr:DUF362 domain-containing protein [Deltaproteobacteria bacterium]
MEHVGLFRCEHYDHTVIREILENGFPLIGFSPEAFRSARVALKPNLLSPSFPERAIITHPEVFRAAAEAVLDHGGTPVLVESPALASISSTLSTGGYRDIIFELGIEVPQGKKIRKLSYPPGKIFRHFEISGGLFETDMILNLPKFKTHGLTYISAAVKNLFGVVPGLRKSQMHMRFSDRQSFSDFLLDLNGALLNGFESRKPVLHVMDAIVAMEGNGPGSSGTARKLGALLMGQDAVALDYVACSLARLDVRQVITITSGFQRDFFISGPEEIEVVGERIEDLQVFDFVAPSVSLGSRVLWRSAASRVVRDLFIDRLEPDKNRCILCYRCMQICPAGAIEKAEKNRKIPTYRTGKCIRCFCCVEVCPEDAIRKKRGVFQKLMGA